MRMTKDKNSKLIIVIIIRIIFPFLNLINVLMNVKKEIIFLVYKLHINAKNLVIKDMLFLYLEEIVQHNVYNIKMFMTIIIIVQKNVHIGLNI